MSEYTIKYPLDLTGQSPENRIEGEPHTLAPGINRSIVPRYGAFYTDGLVVRDVDSSEILVANDQYIPIMYHAEASERAGKEVCAGIIVTDGTVSENVSIDYQVVGDVYQNLTQVILDLIDNLNLDEREVMWGDLLGRPDAFPPAHHLHDLGDIFGFEYLVQSVGEVRDAILYGDVASHDELKAMIEDRRQELQNNINILRGEYEEHRDRVDNPHEVTKAQVGLGTVANHPLANRAEAEDGTLHSRYMTPLRTSQLIEVTAGVALDEHKADYTNPHRVTKAQVGLGTLTNDRQVARAGDTMTGNLNFVNDGEGITWNRDTDGASILFYSDSDNDPDTRLEFQTHDNGDEYFRWTHKHSSSNVVEEYMRLDETGLTVDKKVTAASFHGDGRNLTGMVKSQVGLSNIPNAITSSRTLNSVDHLLTARGMVDHVASGDHDHRYYTKAQQDGRYVNVTGDTMTGNLNVNGATVFQGSMARPAYIQGSNRYASVIYGPGGDDGGLAIRANDGNNDEYGLSLTNANDTMVFGIKAYSGDIITRDGALPRMRINANRFQVLVAGAWRTVWPAQWQ